MIIDQKSTTREGYEKRLRETKNESTEEADDEIPDRDQHADTQLEVFGERYDSVKNGSKNDESNDSSSDGDFRDAPANNDVSKDERTGKRAQRHRKGRQLPKSGASKAGGLDFNVESVQDDAVVVCTLV